MTNDAEQAIIAKLDADAQHWRRRARAILDETRTPRRHGWRSDPDERAADLANAVTLLAAEMSLYYRMDLSEAESAEGLHDAERNNLALDNFDFDKSAREAISRAIIGG